MSRLQGRVAATLRNNDSRGNILLDCHDLVAVPLGEQPCTEPGLEGPQVLCCSSCRFELGNGSTGQVLSFSLQPWGSHSCSMRTVVWMILDVWLEHPRKGPGDSHPRSAWKAVSFLWCFRGCLERFLERMGKPLL